MANFWKGKDNRLVFSFEGDKLTLTAVDWKVKLVGEDIEEDIIGEDRARLDFVASHYAVDLTAKQEEVGQIRAFVNSQKARDLRQLKPQSSLAILIFPENGTRAAFQCREYILGQWEMTGGGRKERNKLTIPGRCRYFDELKTL